MPFRSCDESLSSSNRGNFLELEEMLSKYYSVLKFNLDAIKKQASHKKQVSLLSYRTQNDLIKALAAYVNRSYRKKFA